MGMQQFVAPALPVPPNEYNQQYVTNLIRALRLYFNQLDSTASLQIDGLSLLSLPTSGYGLRTGTVFRVGEDLKIVVPNVAYTAGVSSSGSIGSVTATPSINPAVTTVSGSGSLGTVSVTTS
jgi:hypothetical protein